MRRDKEFQSKLTVIKKKIKKTQKELILMKMKSTKHLQSDTNANAVFQDETRLCTPMHLYSSISDANATKIAQINNTFTVFTMNRK